ncbi:MAG: hypothetical protein CVT81_03010 [Alphaproteobacteria bacterium HGW-Alphaproteobacteria-3]|nr:MAG: hypothetical protein CVT81_03010 [Alphaproteobacteria bacterium HGW-Alphaproteobacteria-3]
MLTANQIEKGKQTTTYTESDPRHEHDDCVRIAYEWLDAQPKLKGHSRSARPIKHLIERWAGRYVSTSDVEVAAHLHPEIRGRYPYFNLSSRLVEPSLERLRNIGEANKHSNYRDDHQLTDYSSREH